MQSPFNRGVPVCRRQFVFHFSTAKKVSFFSALSAISAVNKNKNRVNISNVIWRTWLTYQSELAEVGLERRKIHDNSDG
jgi:hypothetical protein